jgi:tetratricopeptide (TPR) repeat protein
VIEPDDEPDDDAPDHDAADDDAPDHDAPDDDAPDDDADEAGGADDREPGYLWSFVDQEERLGGQYDRHMEILDEMEAGEILELDLERAGDYLVWAAAQSLEEQGRIGDAIDRMRRLHESRDPHAALSYPEIRMRLADLLRDRGDYAEALLLLDRVETEEAGRREACRERRAEILVLSGRVGEGLSLFEAAVRAVPDDPFVPLAAAWSLIRSGDYDGAQAWIDRGERAARRLEDETETRTATAEVDRLRDEARDRSARRERPPQDSPPAEGAQRDDGFEGRRQAILAELDAEEIRLTRQPARSPEEQSEALARLIELHRRASSAWDDAVERGEQTALAGLEDLQADVVELAERFGFRIPGTED